MIILNNPLQELDSIHANQVTKEKTLDSIFHKKRYPKALLCLPLIACLLLFFIFSVEPSTTPVAYVSLDINPSMELHLNQENIVVETVAYNQEAQKILDQVSIQGKKLQSAIQQLLNDTQYENYLSDGILEVTVFSDNQKLSQKIESTLNLLFEKHLDTNQYHCSQITQETHHNAATHHISAGKYQIIEAIISYTSQYSLEELNQLSIQELYTILYNFNQELVPDRCQPNHNQDNHHQNHKHS